MCEGDRPFNPFTNPQVVSGYESWYESSGARADRLEKSLLRKLLGWFPNAHSILEVGCGTGHFTRWLESRGFWVVGLDLAAPMLAEADQLGTHTCVHADALRLPFKTDAFDLSAFLTTLEFLADPVSALTEARRVSRQGLVVGAINRNSRVGRQYQRRGGPVWESARFFTPDELRRMLLEIAGDRTDVIWRTTLWPMWPGALPLPGGGFIGMMAKWPS
jgi:ubiquinone/menaquinone biosynthesis C-methylase UbiE